jgi:hypothetical protein
MTTNLDVMFIIALVIFLFLLFLFMWYSDRALKQFIEFLREEREAREQWYRTITDALRGMQSEINHLRVQVGTITMIDRRLHNDGPPGDRERRQDG